VRPMARRDGGAEDDGGRGVAGGEVDWRRSSLGVRAERVAVAADIGATSGTAAPESGGRCGALARIWRAVE
jgi:hypothetical protein